jgi:hypothetical protein
MRVPFGAGDVDLVAAEHRIASFRHPALLCQLH